jgi:outer membrane protein OmpA-like peptidoglycan-associated protein
VTALEALKRLRPLCAAGPSTRVLAVAAILLGLLSLPAAAQPVDAARARPGAVNRVGLCQCTANRSTLQWRCLASAPACEAACTSPVYAFLPLSQNALSICPPTELYVVLPNADGRTGSGAIEVSDGKASTLLNRTYGAAAVLGGDAAELPLQAAETQGIFAQAIAARPPLPHLFRLYFETGSNQPTADGAAEYRNAVADIKARPVYEIEVIGHTDTVADNILNQKLSLDRATAIRQALIGDGVDARAIAITGRGKTNLAVRTGDNVPELRNRRVELLVR